MPSLKPQVRPGTHRRLRVWAELFVRDSIGWGGLASQATGVTVGQTCHRRRPSRRFRPHGILTVDRQLRVRCAIVNVPASCLTAAAVQVPFQ